MLATEPRDGRMAKIITASKTFMTPWNIQTFLGSTLYAMTWSAAHMQSSSTD